MDLDGLPPAQTDAGKAAPRAFVCPAESRNPKDGESGRVPPGAMSPRDLIPTLHYDAQTVMDAAGPLERFAGLSCEILLLDGSKSARNLTASVDGLSTVLPGAKRVTLQGVGHTAADNSRQPARVAAELREFFA